MFKQLDQFAALFAEKYWEMLLQKCEFVEYPMLGGLHLSL